MSGPHSRYGCLIIVAFDADPSALDFDSVAEAVQDGRAEVVQLQTVDREGLTSEDIDVLRRSSEVAQPIIDEANRRMKGLQ